MSRRRALLLQAAAGGGGNPTFVQEANAIASTVTLASAPTDGNLLAVVTHGSTDPSTFSSLTGAGYAMDVSINNSSGGRWGAIFTKTAASDSATVTVTEGLGTNLWIAYLEFDTPSTFTVDQTATAQSGGSSVTTMTATSASLTGSPSVAIAMAGCNGSTTSMAASSPLTNVTLTATAGGLGYDLPTGTSAVTGAFTWATGRRSLVAVAVYN